MNTNLIEQAAKKYQAAYGFKSERQERCEEFYAELFDFCAGRRETRPNEADYGIRA